MHLPGRAGPGPVTGPVTGAAVPAETQRLDGNYGHVTVTQSPPARDRPQDAEHKRWPASPSAPASPTDTPRGWSLWRIYRRGLPSTTLSSPGRRRPRSAVCWWHHACWAEARSVKRCYAEGGRSVRPGRCKRREEAHSLTVGTDGAVTGLMTLP